MSAANLPRSYGPRRTRGPLFGGRDTRSSCSSGAGAISAWPAACSTSATTVARLPSPVPTGAASPAPADVVDVPPGCSQPRVRDRVAGRNTVGKRLKERLALHVPVLRRRSAGAADDWSVRCRLHGDRGGGRVEPVARPGHALRPFFSLQLFACSSGFDVLARRGHYDLLPSIRREAALVPRH